MPHIVLTPEQAQVVHSASGPVEIRANAGAVLARILPPHEAAIVEEAKRRLASSGPWYSGADVLARLKRLDEIAQGQELTPERVRDLLDRMRAGEAI